MSAANAKVIIVTAVDCPACHNFKSNILPELLTKLRRDFRDEDIIKIEFETRRVDTSVLTKAKVPKEISTYIGFFPSIILVPKSRWNRNLEAVVYGAEKRVSTGKYGHKSDIKMNAGSMYQWITNQLRTNHMFSETPREPEPDRNTMIPTSRTRKDYDDWDPWVNPTQLF